VGGINCPEDDVNGQLCSRQRSVEVLDDRGSLQKSCNAPDFPLAVFGATGAFLDGKVVICGGDSSEGFTRSCYELESGSDRWVESLSLPGKATRHMRSSVLGQKWLLSGGQGGGGVETFVLEQGIFTPGPELPFSKFGHCQLTLNSTHIFFAGDGVETFLYDWPRYEWIFLDDLPADIAFGACGLLNSDEKGQGKEWVQKKVFHLQPLLDQRC